VNILYVIANLSPKHGGPPKACVEMAQGLVARGHRVDIFTTDQDGSGCRMDVPTDLPLNVGGVAVHYFHADTLRGWPCVSTSLWRALRARIPDYDIVHNHSLYLFHGMISGHYCRKYGVPYLIRPCGVLDPYIFRRHRFRKAFLERLFGRRNLRYAAAVNFTTEAEMSLARKALPFGNSVVVPLGLHLENYRMTIAKGLFRKTFPVVGDKKIILFLSRINFKKGLDILIPAFARVAAKRGDVHLVLAGPDNEGLGSKVREWIEAKGIGDITTFTGMLQDETKMAALNDAEMFVLPSYSENFGIAVIEAMACGLPVVISDKVNIWPEISTAKAGLVVPCDVTRVANAMAELLDDPARASGMGNNGKNLVEERYSWPIASRAMEDVYGDILGD